MGKFDTIHYVDEPQVEVAGKRVLLRLDLNVPLDADGMITSDKRIRASLPTINLLRERGAKVVIMSHLGRPKGNPNPRLSLKTVSLRLAELLKCDVHMLPDCVGTYVESRTREMNDGEVVMLENVRFHERETKDADAFGKDLVVNGDFYVNDAFGTCHRAHGSVTGVAKILPYAAGLLIRKELKAFGKVFDEPKRPFVALLGGAKVSDKLGVIEALLDQVDTLIIGGGMAYTFLKASGREIGKSIVDNDKLEFAQAMMRKADEVGVKLLLAQDHVVANGLEDESATLVDIIPADKGAFDIGAKSIELFSKSIAAAGTIVFNGPVGVFERSRFSNGTQSIVGALADAYSSGSTVIVGGGDSAAAVEMFDHAEDVTHISTGGGASLELLEGKELPGLAALS